jgi:dTDP-glucose 4,6-dehydratase
VQPGFIGSHYVRSVLAGRYDGPEVEALTVLDKLTYAGVRANLAAVDDDPRFRFVEGDVCDAALLGELLPGHDAVVHFAAESHVDRSITGAADFVVTNVLGTQTLPRPRSSPASSGRARLHRRGLRLDRRGRGRRRTMLEPNSPYAASKAGSDLIARAYARTHGLDVRITRCSNNYGPHQFPEKVIPLFVTRLLDGLDVPLYGDGGNVRDWLHVDDHCRGIHLVLVGGRAGDVYNIGGGTELTNRDLTGLILDAMGADWSRVQPVEDRKGHDRRYSVDITKITTELGYVPRVPFAEGLEATIVWYRDHEAWWRPLQARAGARG